MLNSNPMDIEQYCFDHTTPESSIISKLEAETVATRQNSQMLVGRVEGMFLKLLVRMTGARRVLEIGTFTGYSALWMAEGLPEDGRLITCEIDEEVASIARRYWKQSPHGKKIELLIGPAQKTVEALEGPFDLVFIDADKENSILYWDTCIPKVRPGGVIAVDNVLWYGRVLDPVETDDKAMAAFNKHVKNDKRVDAVMISVRDGITVACKR